MLSPASPEFIALCRSQIQLLTEGLGAVLSIVYLTEELTELADAPLVPIAAYPEGVMQWSNEQTLSLMRGNRVNLEQPKLASEISSTRAPVTIDETALPPLQIAERALLRQQQSVLPLMHENVVMGLLITARLDRPWTENEQEQIEQIAHTLAIGCLLDQRAQWAAQDMRQLRQLHHQRQDVFDTLLHQFRNPLTALRTFGKLLLKRLRPEDSNYSVAEGIIRESERLQDLLQQFEVALDWEQPSSPPAKIAPGVTPSPNASDSSPPALTSSKSPLLLPGTNWVTGALLQVTPHALTEVLSPLLSSADAIAQDRQLMLHSSIATPLPPALVDPKALREVLTNLIDNALKYTPVGGAVYVGVLAYANHQQAIVIADTGPGIPPEDQAHLFERHYRGVQAKTDIPGTGLGLAIARDLVRQMQGDIEVFSPMKQCDFIPAAMLAQTDAAHLGTAIVVRLRQAEQN
ncbi:ATP-binding protein [Leptolyngbya sp. FACHB-711]|uniref:sensor histidine kinase n=1 Tax=unclassified Leptolyngbya TaxID=2650499 RepID=UPI0016891733|nr:ATP-binding protein [Leptolyngbya sp. FACHB-711]MBD1852377.1 GAF domain-containing sensor histidine kinase [Cyanobacteria bacterium FACHB-502]MBD2027597.1 GAF domain-containing sensor histidine kinase [Leptolyngbya sp. FACHB-711]